MPGSLAASDTKRGPRLRNQFRLGPERVPVLQYWRYLGIHSVEVVLHEVVVAHHILLLVQFDQPGPAIWDGFVSRSYPYGGEFVFRCVLQPLLGSSQPTDDLYEVG